MTNSEKNLHNLAEILKALDSTQEEQLLACLLNSGEETVSVCQSTDLATSAGTVDLPETLEKAQTRLYSFPNLFSAERLKLRLS